MMMPMGSEGPAHPCRYGDASRHEAIEAFQYDWNMGNFVDQPPLPPISWSEAAELYEELIENGGLDRLCEEG
jgi:hypothetical protein